MSYLNRLGNCEHNSCGSEPARDGGVSGKNRQLTDCYREQAHSYSVYCVSEEF